MDEVQVVATVLSLEPEADPEFVAMTAVSAALSASDIPWLGPMVSSRVGMIEGKYVLNPTVEQRENETQLDMMISFAGEDRKFLAVEAEADILPENQSLKLSTSHEKVYCR